MSSNESTIEEAFLFEELGYGIAHSPNTAPGGPRAMRDSFDQVVLVERLRDATDRTNPSTPHKARGGPGLKRGRS
jgi:type I restriction enzyme R subunit